ncbi:hypothetical protein EDD18DRAFT_1370543 [Armillaria luteobubalina]|uniref:Uncharacterized protein n=1 Tax=Armillaria luteobubalina TaxID=153913 RepID=A0AA39NUH4_9AGAR|nr:hypothetical protein EDD18DRAFT_1370543 [Armillaria luteobubalina]
MAGPSKRAPSPTPLASESAQAKKAKPTEKAPFKAGPRSIAKEIKRLEDLPGTGETIKYLKVVLKREKRRELALAAGSNDASRNIQ